ncbi:MAG: hypothetical protein WDN69_31085 [Aliidongia sp.]
MPQTTPAASSARRIRKSSIAGPPPVCFVGPDPSRYSDISRVARCARLAAPTTIITPSPGATSFLLRRARTSPSVRLWTGVRAAD